jgi:ABC-2 type transport system ATP-binding protein
VTKRFGDVHALRRLDLDIAKGRITALLGPNGAGKTTAIRLITGAMPPDDGTVSVFGTDPSGPDGERVRRRCGVVSAKPSLYDRLDGRDNLRYAAELYGLGRGAGIDRRIEEAAERFGIEAALGQLVGGYSTGMKTRLALARAVLHEPELLLLDEPTSGLDPESARSVLDLVRQMATSGRSVLLCTHLLLEAEGLADEVVVVQDGTTLIRGAQDDLARRYWPHPEVTIRCFDGAGQFRLGHHPAVLEATPIEDGVRVKLRNAQAVTGVVKWLTDLGAPLRAVVPWEPSLEDLYFAIRREHRLDAEATDGTGGGGSDPDRPADTANQDATQGAQR